MVFLGDTPDVGAVGVDGSDVDGRNGEGTIVDCRRDAIDDDIIENEHVIKHACLVYYHGRPRGRGGQRR